MPQHLFRAMKSCPADGLPEVGCSARELGVRPGRDIPVTGGIVRPSTGGMSVVTNDPSDLPAHRKPPSLLGSGKDPVFKISDIHIPSTLRVVSNASAQSNNHFVIEPARCCLFRVYTAHLASTRDNWQIAIPI